MDELIKVGVTENSSDRITSLELVKQINLFRKQEGNRSELRHDTLRSRIKDEFDEEILSQKILEKSVSSNGGRPTLVFELSLSQSRQTLIYESKFVRKAVIFYIEKLENALRDKQKKLPNSFSEALRLATEQAERIEKQKMLLDEQKPKVDFFDSVADSKTAVPINSVAKVVDIIGYGRDNLFEFLRNEKILMSNNQPYQKYIDCGYFRIIEQRYMKNYEVCINFKTLVYQRGIEFIRKTIFKKQIK